MTTAASSGSDIRSSYTRSSQPTRAWMLKALFRMRLVHMNCISSCPLGGALMDRRSVGLRGKLACHCILIESGSELILFDTGYGLLDCATPKQRLSQFFLRLMDPEFRPELTAARQIEALG